VNEQWPFEEVQLCKIERVCCISYACLDLKRRTSHFDRSSEDDFQETSRQVAVMTLDIQETSQVGAVMMLESKTRI